MANSATGNFGDGGEVTHGAAWPIPMGLAGGSAVIMVGGQAGSGGGGGGTALRLTQGLVWPLSL